MSEMVSLLGRNGFLPHGYCFTWSPGLLWSMVGADAATALAYFSIPVAVMSYVRKRPEPSTKWIAWLFSAFIFSCGITHVMDIWTIWQPDYALQALSKVVTAVISLVTAVALWPLIPKALKIPSVHELKSAICALESEVAKRRSAEDQLAAIQQSLAVTLSSIEAGFIACDRMGNVTHMNKVAEEVTGRTQREATGVDLWTVFEREGRPLSYLSKNPVDVMIDEGITAEIVHRVTVVSKTGNRTPLEVRSGVTRSEVDGEITGVAVVFRDMSRIVKAEAETSRLAAIVESSADAIIGKTLDGLITSWNGAAQSMFGYTAEEAIGQPVKMLIPEDRQDDEGRIVAELWEGRQVPTFDTVRITRGGERRDVQITISPIKDGAGKIVGASKIARDVSLQRKAEAALRASEERLRFTLEAAHIGDWELDLETGVMQHSPRNDQCFGYMLFEGEWTFDTFVEHVHPEDRDEVQQRLHVAVREKRDWVVQCRVVWPDKSIHWISKHGSLQMQGEKSTRMLGIVTEITEQRQAENARLTAQRLEAENRQIQEANRLKSQFLANMSHELRTPLNAVIGFSDLLHSGFIKPDSPKHHEFLGHIGTSGRHLLQLINDVLDLAKVESGTFEFKPVVVDLSATLKEVRAVLDTEICRKHIAVSTFIEDGVGEVTLDPAKLKQVLYNYLSNAIKFTPQGGSVTVRCMAQGEDHFRVEVEDTGIGIAAGDLKRLFTEFQQLDAGYSKHHQGTGLGLALTRKLVEAQGGEVGVRSTVGIGSMFYVILNRQHGRDEPKANVSNLDGSQQRVDRVLVIEEDSVAQALLANAFKDAGFEVDAWSDDPSSLKRARGTEYSALTLDLGLDGQRGLELLDSIRSQGASHSSPVVGVTMPAEMETKARFAIANVLCKPIRSDEIWSSMGSFKLLGEERANVMVIDDEESALDLMRATLKSIGIDAVCFTDGRVALKAMVDVRPDAIMLDLMMPEFDGVQVLDALQRMPDFRNIPVFIWTSMILTDAEYSKLERSARAILLKGGGAMETVLESVRHWSKERNSAKREAE